MVRKNRWAWCWPPPSPSTPLRRKSWNAWQGLASTKWLAAPSGKRRGPARNFQCQPIRRLTSEWPRLTTTSATSAEPLDPRSCLNDRGPSLSPAPSAVAGLGSGQQTRLGRFKFGLELRDQCARTLHLVNGTNALTATPNVFPSFGLVATKVHFAGVAFSQMLRI